MRPQTETINLVFEGLFKAFEASDITVTHLEKLKHEMLTAALNEKSFTLKAATEFSVLEVVEHFDLMYSHQLDTNQKHDWNIEDEIEVFDPSPCLKLLLTNYTRIYDRSSEAACRVGMDLLLCECTGKLQDRDLDIETTPSQPTENVRCHTLSKWNVVDSIFKSQRYKRQGRDLDISTSQPEDGRRTPSKWKGVKVYCEVSFTHPITPTTSEKIEIKGRVDYAIGFLVPSIKRAFNHLFYSLLLCVEAKNDGGLEKAFAQLLAYLGSLRQSRINKKRTDTSVYGVSTDGLSYIFVTITHEGVIKRSTTFSLWKGWGESAIVLGALKHILEIAMSKTPTSTPEKAQKGKSKASDDSELEDASDHASDHPVIDLYDSEYMHPPDSESDEDQ